MGRIIRTLGGGDYEGNNSKKGDEAGEHVLESGGFLEN